MFISFEGILSLAPNLKINVRSATKQEIKSNIVLEEYIPDSYGNIDIVKYSLKDIAHFYHIRRYEDVMHIPANFCWNTPNNKRVEYYMLFELLHLENLKMINRCY